ncbi:cyclase family protein [Rhodococcus koreensis]
MTETDRPLFCELPVLEGTAVRSAWGHYGPDDALGAVNLLTPEVVRAAAGLVRAGDRFVLSLPLGTPDPPFFGREPLEHDSFATMPGSTDDRLDSFYPQAGTQWDALGHHGYVAEPGYYNGRSESDVLERGELGIDGPAEKGIVTRGVLLDVPRYFAARTEEYRPDTRVEIGADLLMAVAEAQGVELRTGDILCIRTGWIEHYKSLDRTARVDLAEASNRLAFETPGLAPAADIGRLVWDNGVVAVAMDNPGIEPFPPPMTGGDQPAPDSENLVHTQLLTALGVLLGEFFDFDDLAAACASDGRYDFLFTSAPLRIIGGIGSPPNAIAIR